MPTVSQHSNQYVHNKEILALSEFDLTKNTNYDWIVTITFYTALHLVEKALASLSNPYHSKKHKDRNNLVFSVDILKPIATHYQTLYNQSLRARYNCYSFTTSDVQQVLNYLQIIEKQLA